MAVWRVLLKFRLMPLLDDVLEGSGASGKRSPITVRRFAGHLAYAERLDRPLRVVHLTDQHVGRVTAMRVQLDAVAAANAAKPDVVVVTGDFVCHSHAYLDQLIEVLSAFEVPVFGVLGNHDHWSGASEVRRALRKGGVEVLDNANTTITLGHQRLQVVGLDDAYTGHADVERAVKGLDPRLPTLGLSHIAEMADPLWHHRVPLVLSGHTHAGQITWAKLHELSIGRLAGHRYVHGLYGSRHGPPPYGAVYVGAGIGAAVMPLRLGERARREVTIFELGAVPRSFDEHHDEQEPLPGRPPSEKTKLKRHLVVHKKAARRKSVFGKGAKERV